MPIGSGLSAQLGMKAESTYGTAVTVDRWFEFTKESIVPVYEDIDSQAIGRGRVLGADRTKRVVVGYTGDIEFEITNKNFGLIFQHMLGQNTVTGTSEKLHTCILDALAQQGKSMTVQIGRPSIDGTVRPFTYAGGKITKWELSAAIGEKLMLTTTWDFKSLATGTALATPSYVASQEMYIFNELAVTYGGNTFHTKSMKLGADPKLATDRRFSSQAKKEPLASGMTDITGELEGEFEDLTVYNNTTAGTQAAMVFTFTLATLIDTNPFKIVITLPVAQMMTAEPKVESPEIVKLPLPFRVLDNRSDAPITLAYHTSDTAA